MRGPDTPFNGILGGREHAEVARNMSIDEDTVNQKSTIRAQIFDKESIGASATN